MSRRALLAVAAGLAGLGAIAIANDARAEPTPWEARRRVVILSSDWEVATRLRRLLGGVSLDARIGAEEAPCDPARVKREGASASASSVLCTDATGIEVWTLDDSDAACRGANFHACLDGQMFVRRERIAWATTPPTIRDEAIVQATEVVRANVASMAPLPPEPAPLPAPPPPARVAPPSAPPRSRPSIRTQRPPPRSPRCKRTDVAPPRSSSARAPLGSRATDTTRRGARRSTPSSA